MKDDIKLYFQVAGHIINRRDGAFASVKRETKRGNVLMQNDMVETVRCSSVTNKVVLPEEVGWAAWKLFLENF